MTETLEADDPDPTEGDRTRADAELVERLAGQGFEGREYERFKEALAAYGLGVMKGWLQSGEIFAKVAKEGFPLSPSTAELDELARDRDARDELADSTVTVALVRFRRQALIGRSWRPDGGRSLASYFVGRCLREFPNEMRRFRRSRRAQRNEYATDLLDSLAGSGHATEILHLFDQVAGPDEKTRRVVKLVVEGYRQREIADLTGMTVRAVEGLLRRLRRKLAEEGGNSRG